MEAFSRNLFGKGAAQAGIEPVLFCFQVEDLTNHAIPWPTLQRNIFPVFMNLFASLPACQCLA
jgi:hypothetical protein